MTAAPPGRQKLRVPEFDPAAIARAEAALKTLSVQFKDWMGEEVVRLEAALQTAASKHFSSAGVSELYTRAHDVKGLATTYEYPLAGRLADVICELLETEQRREAAIRHRALLEAAVQAIRACLRDNIRSESHPLGALVAQELERKSRDALALAGLKEA